MIDTMRGQLHSGLRPILLEFNAVKAEQALWRTNPHVAIFGLGKRADFARRSIVHAPSPVMELHNTSISVERVRRYARQHDQQADPKSQRDLPIRIERFRRIHNREEPRGAEGSWSRLFHVLRPYYRIRMLLSRWHGSQLQVNSRRRTPINRSRTNTIECALPGALNVTWFSAFAEHQDLQLPGKLIVGSRHVIIREFRTIRDILIVQGR